MKIHIRIFFLITTIAAFFAVWIVVNQNTSTGFHNTQKTNKEGRNQQRKIKNKAEWLKIVPLTKDCPPQISFQKLETLIKDKRGVKVDSELAEFENQQGTGMVPMVELHFIDADKSLPSNEVVRLGINPVEKNPANPDWNIPYLGTGFRSQNPIKYFAVAHPSFNWKNVNADSLFIPGYSYEITIEDPMTYAVITIPEDIKMGEWIRFDIPVGVGVHPFYREYKPELHRVTLEIEKNTPIPGSGKNLWVLSPDIGRKKWPEGQRKMVLELNDLDIELALAVRQELDEHRRENIIWADAGKIKKDRVLIPQDTTLFFRSMDELRSVTVPIRPGIPKAIQCKDLIVYATPELKRKVFFYDVPQVVHEGINEKTGKYEYREEVQTTATVTQRPGTYPVRITGTLKGRQRKDIDQISGEQHYGLVLATGTITIPENAAPGTVVEIENLKLVDISDKFE
jgi:hypothetical protein